MLPKWHTLLGFLFSYIIYWFTSITIFQASLILFAAIFIDVDHYTWYVLKKKDWNFKNAYYTLKNEERMTRKLMIFHTIEFHIFVGLLSLIWAGFFYILIGMIFHSLIDIADLTRHNELKYRVFSLTKAMIY